MRGPARDDIGRLYRCVALLSPARAFNSLTDAEHGALAGHLTNMARLFDAGELLMGGPFLDGRGGMALFNTDDETRAVELLRKDPAVRAGLLQFGLRRWHVRFDTVTKTKDLSPPQ